MKILICAGHGPNTPGKRSPDGMREYSFNSRVADVMKAELEKYEGVTVIFAHEPGRDVPLAERTKKANAQKADVYVSLHANALRGVMGSHTGIETFVYTTKPQAAVALANKLQSALVSATGLKDRGVKFADFHVLRETNMTAVLIEHGYMDSTIDLPKLKDDAFRVLCGKTDAKALAEYYCLKLKAQPAPVVHAAQTGIIRYISTGGHAYANLQSVHTFLFEGQHGFDVKRGADGSVLFLVGPFDTGMANYAQCTAELAKYDKYMKHLTPGEAAEWRAK